MPERSATTPAPLKRPPTGGGADYNPIESYGVIGDLHSAALVGTDGSIDWLCLPHFDSPSVFGRLVDGRKGGHFSLAAFQSSTGRQLYFPDTNVLITRFSGGDAVAEVTDLMPVEESRRED